jgi:hypothetical protein
MTKQNPIMVAVPGTQAGATKRTFDKDKFERDVYLPVKNFLKVTEGKCPALVFFLVGSDPSYEEKILVQLPEENVADGCPSYLAAETHLSAEIERGLVWLVGLTGKDALSYERALMELMKSRGVNDCRILPPGRLNDLATELRNTTL